MRTTLSTSSCIFAADRKLVFYIVTACLVHVSGRKLFSNRFRPAPVSSMVVTTKHTSSMPTVALTLQIRAFGRTPSFGKATTSLVLLATFSCGITGHSTSILFFIIYIVFGCDATDKSFQIFPGFVLLDTAARSGPSAVDSATATVALVIVLFLLWRLLFVQLLFPSIPYCSCSFFLQRYFTHYHFVVVLVFLVLCSQLNVWGSHLFAMHAHHWLGFLSV